MPSHAHTRGSMNITGYIGYWDIQRNAFGEGAIVVKSRGNWVNNNGIYESDAVRDFIFDASRSWTGETSYAGANYPHENRPPYYAVYYIMKIK